MSQSTAQALATTCLIAGTFLLAIEAIGRDRVKRLESSIHSFTAAAERLLGEAIALMALPWRDIEELSESKWGTSEATSESPTVLFFEQRWIGPAFLTQTAVSWFVFDVSSQHFGERVVAVVSISSWIGMAVAALILRLCLEGFRRQLKRDPTVGTKLSLLAHTVAIGIVGLIFGATTLVTFLSCWPGGAIFVLYIGFYLVVTSLRRLIDFRIRHQLGNIFVLGGLALSALGIVLQHLVSTGVFG